VADEREGARPASRLRAVAEERVSLPSCIIPSLFPPRADASPFLATLEPPYPDSARVLIPLTYLLSIGDD